MVYYDHAVMMHYGLGVWEVHPCQRRRKTQESAWTLIRRWFGR